MPRNECMRLRSDSRRRMALNEILSVRDRLSRLTGRLCHEDGRRNVVATNPWTDIHLR